MQQYKFIKINLSTGAIKTETISDQVLTDFIGGRGIGAYYLYRDSIPGVDPLGPDNKLLLITGPLSGAGSLSTSRWMAVTKSPLTGGYARAVGGADFGAWLMWSGYAFIEIEGKANKPVYIHFNDDTPQILDAADLWGKEVTPAQELLQQKHGKDTRAACIGPAGEKLVRYSAIFSDRRSASRCGVGTVMGSKNLKAVAITTKRNVRLYDTETFKELIKAQSAAYQSSPAYKSHREWGTTDTQRTTNMLGIYPTKNFREGRMQDYEKLLGGEYLKLRSGEFACYSCPARCGKAHTITSGPYAGMKSDGPEYESIWAFTGPINSLSIEASIAADGLCDELGIDTISTGNSIGFAYELYEKGILTKSDTDGIELKYGDHAAMMKLIGKIGNREGIGNILAEGVKRAADIIGKGSEKYAIHCKGMEPAAYEPRGAKNMGFNYATSNIGASHCYGYGAQDVWGAPVPKKVNRFEEGNADVVVYNQDHAAMNEIGIICAFSAGWGWVPDIYGKMLAAATGVKQAADPAYLLKVGERILNMERAFNVREGFGRKDDTLPVRMLTENLIVDGVPNEAARVKDLQGFLDRYYAVRGWTNDGAPAKAKVKELGLDYILK
jgi:aldehyde:ferredoxin oxidoreductase